MGLLPAIAILYVVYSHVANSPALATFLQLQQPAAAAAAVDGDEVDRGSVCSSDVRKQSCRLCKTKRLQMNMEHARPTMNCDSIEIDTASNLGNGKYT